MHSRSRDAGRKYESGCSKKKKTMKRKQEEENLRGSLNKFFKIGNQVAPDNPILAESDTALDSIADNLSGIIVPSTSSCAVLPGDNNCENNETTRLLSLSQTESMASTSSYTPPIDNIEASNLLCLRPSSPPSPQTKECEEFISVSKTGKKEAQISENDPGLWPLTFTDVDRTDIVIKGRIRMNVDFFPVNNKGRRFSEFHYRKYQPMVQNVTGGG